MILFHFLRFPSFLTAGLLTVLAITGISCRQAPEGSEGIVTSEADRLNELRETLGVSLEEIDSWTDSEKKDPAYKDLAVRLIFDNRLTEAAEIAGKIEASAERYPLLDSIARLQIRNAMDGYRIVSNVSSEVPMSGGLLVMIEQARHTARMIDDPLRRTETLISIALSRASMNDWDGADQVYREAAESLRSFSGDDIEKAKSFCTLARWFFDRDQRETALSLCREADAALLPFTAHPDSTELFLDLAMLYRLLDREAEAEKARDNARKSLDAPGELKRRPELLLRLAEETLPSRIGEKGEAAARNLLDLKALVLEAADLLRECVVESVASSPSVPENGPPSPVGSITPVAGTSVVELNERKNALLQKIATLQIWRSPLEDVWETILDMDEGSPRDDTLVATIEMLLATDRSEDAAAWSEEITDPEKRKAIRTKIEP